MGRSRSAIKVDAKGSPWEPCGLQTAPVTKNDVGPFLDELRVAAHGTDRTAVTRAMQALYRHSRGSDIEWLIAEIVKILTGPQVDVWARDLIAMVLASSFPPALVEQALAECLESADQRVRDVGIVLLPRIAAAGAAIAAPAADPGGQLAISEGKALLLSARCMAHAQFTTRQAAADVILQLAATGRVVLDAAVRYVARLLEHSAAHIRESAARCLLRITDLVGALDAAIVGAVVARLAHASDSVRSSAVTLVVALAERHPASRNALVRVQRGSCDTWTLKNTGSMPPPPLKSS
jgi:hypothetical protein